MEGVVVKCDSSFSDKSGIASTRFLDGLYVLSSLLVSQNPDFSSKILFALVASRFVFSIRL